MQRKGFLQKWKQLDSEEYLMPQRVLKRIMQIFTFFQWTAPPAQNQPKRQENSVSISQREMVSKLSNIPYWEDKINFAKSFVYHNEQGTWIQPVHIPATETSFTIPAPTYQKVNYGCGGNIIDGWLNLDLYKSNAKDYKRANLLEKHPFNDNSILFGFSEDMLEHLNQAESIFFLSEIYRTLAPSGVIRLSFPGLEGVLQKHYTPITEKRVREGELEAYSFWDHIHFYSREELRTVAIHLGFTNIEFFEYGKSNHKELSNLDTREHQIGLNTYAELVK